MLNSRSSSCLLLSLVLIGATPPAAPPTLAQTLEAIHAFAPVAMARQGAPGMSLAIVDKNGVLRIESVGFANRETREPVTPQTRFGIGSITKSFTAGALLQLKDAGRFDDMLPVTHYLPWFRIHSAYRPITAHDLFSHSSGLPDGGLSTGYAGPASLRDWFAGYAPGTHWSYSNVGYDTLGAILTTIDRSDYQSIIARRIFEPLEMTHSTTIWNPQTLADAATDWPSSVIRTDDGSRPWSPRSVPPKTTVTLPPLLSIDSMRPDAAAPAALARANVEKRIATIALTAVSSRARAFMRTSRRRRSSGRPAGRVRPACRGTSAAGPSTSGDLSRSRSRRSPCRSRTERGPAG